MSWRDVLKIHPAADLFPLLSEPELKELAEDIKVNGLRAPIVGWNSSEGQLLLDGRNRLDALALLGLLYETSDHHVGLKKWDGKQWTDQQDARIGYASGCEFHTLCDGDPYAIALSLNVHRRHLTAEQKRELIAKVLKATPEKSNVQIAKQVKADDKTVAKVRAGLESTSEIPRLEKIVGADGKSRPAKAKKKSTPIDGLVAIRAKRKLREAAQASPAVEPEVRSTGNDVDTELSAEVRRAEMAALAEAEAITPKAPAASSDEMVATVITTVTTTIVAAINTSLLPNGLLNSLSLDALKALAPDLHRAREWIDAADDLTRSHLRKKKKVS